MKERIILAYSGGLDTSVAIGWIAEATGAEVVAVAVDVGQGGESLETIRQRALDCGAVEAYVADARDEFAEQYCMPTLKANALYMDAYPLVSAISRPVISRHLVAAARQFGASTVAHGCTGKGNDQVRFELAFYGLKPDIKVIAPWRLPKFYERFAGRSALLEYAESKGIPVTQTKSKPWSTDENLFHISYEAGILEDPNTTPPDDMWKLTQSPQKAPDTPEKITIEFKQGIPVKVTKTESGESYTDSVDVFLQLNALARKHGIGRVDIVENRFIGVKSRGCYESPGATILRAAHIDLEGLTLDREVRRLRDQIVTTKFSEILYYGFFFSPESKYVRGCIPPSQTTVNGVVKLSLYKGNVVIEGRSSNELLYDEKFSSMDELGGFEPENTSGFIAVQAIRLRRYGLGQAEKGKAGADTKAAYALE